MDSKSTFIEGLAKFLEILPIAIAILDEDFQLVDFNFAFENFLGGETDDNPVNFKKLWERQTAVKGTIESPDGYIFKLLIFPDVISEINNEEDFLVQLRVYLDGLKFAKVLNIDDKKLMSRIAKEFTAKKPDTYKMFDRKKNFALAKAIIANRNFVERNILEEFVRKLGYHPIVRWLEDDIEKLIDISGNVEFVVISDNIESLLRSIKIPAIILVDFGRKVEISEKFPDAQIIERPLNFEDFKEAVEKIKKID